MTDLQSNAETKLTDLIR